MDDPNAVFEVACGIVWSAIVVPRVEKTGVLPALLRDAYTPIDADGTVQHDLADGAKSHVAPDSDPISCFTFVVHQAGEAGTRVLDGAFPVLRRPCEQARGSRAPPAAASATT